MKNGKAPGPESICVELIEIFNKCRKGDEVSKEWKKATITSIFKKGSRRDCANNRGNPWQESTVVLKKRIEREITESEEQNRFRSERSFTDGLLLPLKIIWLRKKVLVFIDLQKAYDTVLENKLWTSLVNNGVSLGYVSAVRLLYTDYGKDGKPSLFKIYLRRL